MAQHITASMLFDFVACPHKVWRDVWGPQDEKNPYPNDFVKLLWERGVAHEKDVVASLADFVDLSGGAPQLETTEVNQPFSSGIEKTGYPTI